jgi:uncharacterized protein YbaA (DUF1428 family)
MPRYVDGYVVPMAKKKLRAYKKIATLASRVWREHGALEYRECVGEDLAPAMGIHSTKLCEAKKGETVVLAWIVYKSRAHRDRVNAKVMQDPRMASMCDSADLPFDCSRVAFGGFEVLVAR